MFASLTGCNAITSEKTEVVAAKKGIEKYLSDPLAVQYRNIVAAKSLDGLVYHEDTNKLYEQVQVIQNVTDPNLLIENVKKAVAEENAKIKNGAWKNSTGVCLEFNAKNKSGGYSGFEKALCIYQPGKEESECLFASHPKNNLIQPDLTVVCK